MRIQGKLENDDNIVLHPFYTLRPIPVPDFISRQIVLDWVEIVEKEDTQCAHLGMKSLTPRPVSL